MRFKHYTHNADHTTEEDTGSNQRLSKQNITTHGSQTDTWDQTNSNSYKCDKQARIFLQTKAKLVSQ